MPEPSPRYEDAPRVLTQSAVLCLEPFDLFALIAAYTGPLAGVDLGLNDPAVHGLGAEKPSCLPTASQAAVIEAHSPW